MSAGRFSGDVEMTGDTVCFRLRAMCTVFCQCSAVGWGWLWLLLYRISPIPIESFPFSLPSIHHDNISFPFHSSAIAIPSTCSTFPVPIYKCFQVALRVRRRRDRSVFSTHISTRPVDRTQHQITVSACCSRLRHSNAHEKRYVAITVPMAFPQGMGLPQVIPTSVQRASLFCSEVL